MQSILRWWNPTVIQLKWIPAPICFKMQKEKQWHCRSCKENKAQNQLEWKSFSGLRSTLEEKKDQKSNFLDSVNPNVEISFNSKIMNLEKGMEISNCWKEFNGEVRKILSKKLGIQQNSHKSTTLLNQANWTTATLRFRRKSAFVLSFFVHLYMTIVDEIEVGKGEALFLLLIKVPLSIENLSYSYDLLENNILVHNFINIHGTYSSFEEVQIISNLHGNL